MMLLTKSKDFLLVNQFRLMFINSIEQSQQWAFIGNEAGLTLENHWNQLSQTLWMMLLWIYLKDESSRLLDIIGKQYAHFQKQPNRNTGGNETFIRILVQYLMR